MSMNKTDTRKRTRQEIIVLKKRIRQKIIVLNMEMAQIQEAQSAPSITNTTAIGITLEDAMKDVRRIAKQCIVSSYDALKTSLGNQAKIIGMAEVWYNFCEVEPYKGVPNPSPKMNIQIWTSIVRLQACVRGIRCRKTIRMQRTKRATKLTLHCKMGYAPQATELVMQYVFQRERAWPPQVWPVRNFMLPRRPLQGPHSAAKVLATFDRLV